MTTDTKLQALMALADRYADVYSFVGCNTMPDARATLRSALEPLVRDALRFSWLTEGKRGDWIWNHVLMEHEKEGHDHTEDVIDAAIAARSAEPQAGEKT